MGVSLRFGLVGTGPWARMTHGPGLVAADGVDLVGVWGRDPAKAADLAATLDVTPYDDYDAHRPLEAGMVVSVETTLQHPKRGFIKLEDTAVVTATGCDIYGEGARGWNRGGTAA